MEYLNEKKRGAIYLEIDIFNTEYIHIFDATSITKSAKNIVTQTNSGYYTYTYVSTIQFTNWYENYN